MLTTFNEAIDRDGLVCEKTTSHAEDKRLNLDKAAPHKNSVKKTLERLSFLVEARTGNTIVLNYLTSKRP